VRKGIRQAPPPRFVKDESRMHSGRNFYGTSVRLQVHEFKALEIESPLYTLPMGARERVLR
jgi:hypothetical protein